MTILHNTPSKLRIRTPPAPKKCRNNTDVFSNKENMNIVRICLTCIMPKENKVSINESLNKTRIITNNCVRCEYMLHCIKCIGKEYKSKSVINDENNENDFHLVNKKLFKLYLNTI